MIAVIGTTSPTAEEKLYRGFAPMNADRKEKNLPLINADDADLKRNRMIAVTATSLTSEEKAYRGFAPMNADRRG